MWFCTVLPQGRRILLSCCSFFKDDYERVRWLLATVYWLWCCPVHVFLHLVYLVLCQMAHLALVMSAELVAVWWDGLVHSVLRTVVDDYYLLTWLVVVTWLRGGLSESRNCAESHHSDDHHALHCCLHCCVFCFVSLAARFDFLLIESVYL